MTTIVERAARAFVAKMREFAPSMDAWEDATEEDRQQVMACVGAALGAVGVEEMRKALRANDSLVRDIRHRDARWHDDELVKRVLARNAALLARIDGEGV